MNLYGPIQVLIVEDEPDMANMIRMLLGSKFSARSEIAVTCSSAREKLKSGNFDIVTLDYQLPDGDGLKLLEEIKSEKDNPAVIMVTGHGDEQVATESFRLGASSYVVKDQRLSSLLPDAVDHALSEVALRIAKEQISRQKDELQKYLDVVQVIILALNKKGEISLINKKGCEILECDSNEITGKCWFDNFVPERSVSEVQEVFSTLMSGAVELEEYFENPVLTSSGKEKIIAWHNAILRDESGKIIGTLGSGEDITDMRLSELKYKTILQSAMDGFCITDVKGRILETNDAYCEMIGYEHDELLKMDISDIDVIEKPEETKARIERIKNSGYDRFETRHRKKDGGLIDAEVSLKILETDEPQLFVFIRDISEQKEETRELDRTVSELKNRNSELEESVIMQQLFIENLHEGVWMIDPEARTVFVNSVMARMLGFTVDEMLGKPLFEFMDEEEIMSAQAYFSKRKKGIKERHDFTFTKKDGSPMSASLETAPLFDKAGNFIGAAAGVVDTTERDLMKERLKESEKRYRIIADFTYDWEDWCAPDGNFIYVSPSSEIITGYKPEEFIEDADLLIRIIHPDDVKAFRDHLKEMNGRCDSLALEFRVMQKDGKGERWIEHICRPVYDEDGTYLGRRGSNRDITDRKKIDEVLSESERRLRLMVENLPAGAIYVEDGSVYFNKAVEGITGYSNAEIETVDQLIETLFGNSSRRIQEYYEADRSKGFPRARKLSIRKKDGAVRLVEVAGYKHDRYEVWLINDVTERDKEDKAFQELVEDRTREIRRVNAELEGYASTVSHDIRGPLSSAYGALAMLEDLLSKIVSTEAREEVGELLEIVNLNINKASALTEDLLQLAEAGQVPVKPYPVDVSDQVSIILMEIRKDTEKMGVEFEIDTNLGKIVADPTHIYQVFGNLIKNSIKHAETKNLLIEVHKLKGKKSEHRYLIKDNGEGIPEEILDSVFVPFVRRKTGTPGIGLSIVDKILKTYNGEIKTYNDNGACFEFSLCDYPRNDKEE
ncbi:MAG: PAS domain S-box protein [Actinobacteria bacterium]|nr:PAS domain S-box protein [Actinomycetota bacterium]